MSKEDYVQLHTLLAKIKYELEVALLNEADFDYIAKMKKQIEAIDEVASIFIVECE